MTIPVPTGDRPVAHFHIRWSSSVLDWQAFSSTAEATASAERLVRPGETYAIEECETGKCLRCALLTVTNELNRIEFKKKKEKAGGLP